MTCSTIRIWEEDVHHVRARMYRTQHQVRDDTQERTRKKLPKKNHDVVMMWSCGDDVMMMMWTRREGGDGGGDGVWMMGGYTTM